MPPGWTLRVIAAKARRASRVWCRTPVLITTSKLSSLTARSKIFICAKAGRRSPFRSLCSSASPRLDSDKDVIVVERQKVRHLPGAASAFEDQLVVADGVEQGAGQTV